MSQRLLVVVAVFVAGSTLAVAQRSGTSTADSPDVLLKEAVTRELIDGNIAVAIQRYRDIVTRYRATHRDVAAKALLHLARSYERVGSPEAPRTYAEIVADFADQPDAAAEATRKLAAIRPAQTGAQNRLVWDDAIDTGGRVSADGRWLSFVDWETGDIAIRDLTSGQNRRLTNHGGYLKALGEAEINAISPDGRFVAYAWQRWDDRAETEGAYELRVIQADGSNERVLLGGKGVRYVEPEAWSPDGQWIAVSVERSSGPTEIVLIGRDGSGGRTVATFPVRGFLRARYSPDGRWMALGLDAGAGGTPAYEIALMPADGSRQPETLLRNARLVEWTPDGRQLLFTRVRQDALELFSQNVANGRLTGTATAVTAASNFGSSLGLTRNGALFYSKNRRATDAVVGSYDIRTGAPGELQVLRPIAGIGLGAGGGGPKFSPDGRVLLYMGSPSTIVFRRVADGVERSIVPELARLLFVNWGADGQSLIVSGVSRDGTEGLFSVDPASGTTSLIAPLGFVSLFALSPDGRTIYYYGRAPGEAVKARDLTTGTERTLLTWEGALFGMALTSDGATLALAKPDRLVLLDVATGESTVRWQAPVDRQQTVRNPVWLADGRTLVLLATDETDGRRREELWTLPVNGGEPRRHPLPANFRGLSLSPDGRQIAMMRWENIYQVWALEGFLPSAR